MARALVIIPTFNEAKNIADLIEAIRRLQPEMDILVVDDGSPDGTGKVVAGLLPTHEPHLKLLERTGKGGRGSAVLAGFKRALDEGYDLVFEMDADFSHKPEELRLFLKAIETSDCVIGSRYLPASEIHGWGIKRTVLSKVANAFARVMLGIPISDYTNGYRCYRRSAIEKLDMGLIDAKGYVVLSEVAMQLHRKGVTLTEVPTVFINRRRGESNLGWHEIREAFLSVVSLRRKYAGQIVVGTTPPPSSN